MSKIRGELRQLSPARRLLGLLPVLVVAFAMVAALRGVGVAGADEPEAATQEASVETEAAVESEQDAAEAEQAAEPSAEDATEPAAEPETDKSADADAPAAESDDSAATDDAANADSEAPAEADKAAGAKAAAPAVDAEDEDLVGDGDYPTNATATAIDIQDDVKANGQFILKATIDGQEYTGAEAAARLAAAGYTVAWSNSNGANCANGLKKVTTTGTPQAVEDNGGWINVAYTNGAKATYTVTVSKTGQNNLSAQKKVTYANQLENGSFEKKDGGGSYFNDQNPSGNVPDWNSTSSHIEIGKGNTSAMSNYVSRRDPDQGAADGTYFAELNPDQYSALYQDVLTIPGQTMYWNFSHRARTAGSNNIDASKGDTMALVIAPLELVENITTQTQLTNFYNSLTNKNGANTVTSGDKTYTVYVYQDNAPITYNPGSLWGGGYYTSAWKNRSGSMTVPEGQYTSRYFFMAVDTASGDSTIGNFLDHVSYSQEQPGVAQDKARLTVEKTVQGLTQDQVSELSKKSFIATEANGSAVTLTLTDVIANDDGSYKLTYTSADVDATSGTSVTFTTTEDTGTASVDGYNMTTTYESAIETSVRAGSTGKVAITNTYTPANKTLTLTKVVDKGDANKEFKFTVSATKGDAAVDLAVPDGGNATVKDGKVTAELHSQESATITVPYGATVSIEETDRDGYTTTYKVGDGEAAASTDGKCTVNNMTADTTVIATNTIKPVTLTIQKEIVGAQADLTKGYTFTVKKGQTTYTSGELRDTQGENGAGDSITLGGKDKTGIELNWGDKVTVEETDNTGYTTTYQVTVGNQGVVNGSDKKTSEITLNADSTTVVFTNTKTNTPVTGIKSAGVPGAVTAVGIAAFAIAGGFALVRRNAAEAGAHMGGRKRRW